MVNPALEDAIDLILDEWRRACKAHGLLPVCAVAYYHPLTRREVHVLDAPGFDREMLQSVVRQLQTCIDRNTVYEAPHEGSN